MIRRMFAVLLTAVMFCMLFSSCVAEDTPTGDSTNPSTSSAPSISGTDTPTLPNDGDTIEPVIPDALIEIPSEYFSAADEQGTLVELIYDTWESKTYEQKTTKLTKRAIVYLPYGYDESKEYNTFYYMHGGWGNETTQMGTPERPSGFKNVIDHAIQNGEIEPMIVVCPTYNNENPDDSANYTLAFYTLTVNYHNELVNDLIPAVDSTYATIPDRDHRAFGGFSMGGKMTLKMAVAYPEMFAAAFPICPAWAMDAQYAQYLADMPIWLTSGTLDPLVNYYTSVTPTWNRIVAASSQPENCRFSTLSRVCYPDGSPTSSSHHAWFAVNYDMFSIDNGDYPHMSTIDGTGSAVTLTYPNGMIAWLSQFSSEYDGAPIDGTGNLNIGSHNLFSIQTMIDFFETLVSIFETIVNTLRAAFAV